MGLKTIEEYKRLSQSMLWDIQKNAYRQFGPKAWSEKGVPSYLTSHPLTAGYYADLVLSFIDDNEEAKQAREILIFDLGAGSGRFAFYFLKIFTPLFHELFQGRLRFRYVMTDFTKENLEFCRTHPELQPWIEQELLDFALFEYGETLHFQALGQPIEPKQAFVILIANYFFDTIPQDFFCKSSKGLQEAQVRLSVPQDLSLDSGLYSPSIIEKLCLHYDYAPLSTSTVYQDSLLQSFFENYVEQLPPSSFLFPIGAFRTLQFFYQYSSAGLFFICMDQGTVQSSNQEPRFAKHGSFSIEVNEDALSQFVRYLGGQSFLPASPNPLLMVLAGHIGASCPLARTARAFERLAQFEPIDFWQLVEEIDLLSDPSLMLISKTVKLGRFDPIAFYSFYARIRKKAEETPLIEQHALVELTKQVASQVYPISKEEGGFLANLGTLLYELKAFFEAIELFEKSLLYTGPLASTYQSIGACHFALQNPQEALKYFNLSKTIENQ